MFDTVVELDAAQIKPQVSWGTSPEMVLAVDQNVPDPAKETDLVKRGSIERALKYMGLKANQAITDIQLDRVFIGSCTNSRIEDLRAAAVIAKGRKVASTIKQAIVVPGSGLVKAQAEAEGLDKIFLEAGFEWREPGCSILPGDEPGPFGIGRALRVHFQPKLRRASGRRWAYSPGQPGHGRCGCRQRSFHRRSRIDLRNTR